MMPEIGDTSVLAFIPTTFPGGLILGERWSHESRRIQLVIGRVDDVQEDSDYTLLHVFDFGTLVKDATPFLLGMAVDHGVVPEYV